jgi:hypothetical protein
MSVSCDHALETIFTKPTFEVGRICCRELVENGNAMLDEFWLRVNLDKRGRSWSVSYCRTTQQTIQIPLTRHSGWVEKRRLHPKAP